MFSTTIMDIPKHFQRQMISKNHFFVVKSTIVQPPLLTRLATVSVLWQRAVNRQPGFRSGNSKSRSPSRSHFPEILKIWKISSFFNFLKMFGTDRTLKFWSHFHALIQFLQTSICSPQQLWRFPSTFRKQWSSKTNFPWSRVSACSRRFSPA